MVKRSKTVTKKHQELFDFLNSTIEPWDGPAAICASDSKWAIAATDRNGLRPLSDIQLLQIRYFVQDQKQEC